MIEIYAIQIESKHRPTEYGFVVDTGSDEGSYMTGISHDPDDIPDAYDEFIRFIDKQDPELIDRIVTNNLQIAVRTFESTINEAQIYTAWQVRNIIMGDGDEINIGGS